MKTHGRGLCVRLATVPAPVRHRPRLGTVWTYPANGGIFGAGQVHHIGNHTAVVDAPYIWIMVIPAQDQTSRLSPNSQMPCNRHRWLLSLRVRNNCNAASVIPLYRAKWTVPLDGSQTVCAAPQPTLHVTSGSVCPARNCCTRSVVPTPMCFNCRQASNSG
jgi:hypothetical protein